MALLAFSYDRVTTGRLGPFLSILFLSIELCFNGLFQILVGQEESVLWGDVLLPVRQDKKVIPLEGSDRSQCAPASPDE